MGHRNFFYACKAGVHNGTERCRNEEGKCPHHDENSPRAPRPDMVLLRFQLAPNWRSRFNDVELDFRTYSERREMEAEHNQDAEKMGRKAYITPLMIKDDHAPESAHSGNPISGKDSGGWKSVDMRGLIAELREAGFALNNVAVLAMSDPKRKPFLVLAFAPNVEEYTEFPWSEFNKMIACPFAFTHVWTNPRDKEGVMKHTATFIGRMDGKPAEHVIHYADGDWGLEPVAIATAV